MKLSLGFSPCPNDTFIFDALVNHKIDTRGLTFDTVLEDVETLNQRALQGKLDISKISYALLPLALEKYFLLNSGSALGRGVGPLLIKRNDSPDLITDMFDVEETTVAIPGKYTTAHLLFSLAFPGAYKKIFLRYDEIEDFVLQEKGFGVIIHENRFTYEAKGLHKITDLGDFWEKETGNPIPLGGIVIKRSIDRLISLRVDSLIKESIEYAYKHHYEELTGYIKNHSQEMSEQVMRKHIDLYVNKYSIELGSVGKKAVEKMLEVSSRIYGFAGQTKNVFLTP